MFVLASANLDQIARDLDFDALQDNLTNIAFCNVELELVRCSHDNHAVVRVIN